MAQKLAPLQEHGQQSHVFLWSIRRSHAHKNLAEHTPMLPMHLLINNSGICVLGRLRVEVIVRGTSLGLFHNTQSSKYIYIYIHSKMLDIVPRSRTKNERLRISLDTLFFTEVFC